MQVYPNAFSPGLPDPDEHPWLGRLQRALDGSAPDAARGERRLLGLSAADVERFRGMMPANPTPAAVLVPVMARPNPTLLFTERAAALRKHSGQIAFPGGRLEPTDAGPVHGALRESTEEIGLPAAAVRVLGRLPEQLILTGYRVTPVVGWVQPGWPVQADPDEVADVFEVPIEFFLDRGNRVMAQRRLGGQIEVELEEFHWEGRRIWGATAEMLFSLAALLENRDG